MSTRVLRMIAICFALAELAAAAGAPVVFNGKTLFTIESGVGAFSPQARARAVEGRLGDLSRSPSAKIDALSVAEGEMSSDIVAGDIIVLSITDPDARTAGKPRHELAAEYAGILQTALRDSRREHGFREAAEGVALSVLVTLLFALLLRVLHTGFARLRTLLESWHGTRIPDIRIQRLELLTADRLVWVVTSACRALEATVVVIAVYFYVSLLLSIFPATRGLSATLLAYLQAVLHTAAAAIAAYAPSLLMILVIAIVTRFAIQISHYLFRGIESGMLTIPGFYSEWATPTYKIVRFLILAIAAVIVFPYIPGHDSPALRGLSIFFGVLFSLGSAGAVGNLVAGLLLTYTRAFQVGDRVRIADTLGDVQETSLLATHIRTVKNEDVTVPNSLVLSSHIVNFSSGSRDGALILHTTVTIGYDAPWREVHRLLLAAARATQHILAEPEPFVLQTALNDFYVSYQINACTDQPRHMPEIYSELHRNIQDKFNEAGLEICSPHFSALRDGNSITIPEDYVPKTYSAPAFRLSRAGARVRTEGAGS